MEALNEKQVMHVANLAKLDINNEEVAKYGRELASILTEIDKILSVDIKNDDILIAPTTNSNMYSSDSVGDMLSRDEIFKNANNASDGYIVVHKLRTVRPVLPRSKRPNDHISIPQQEDAVEEDETSEEI